MIGTKKRIYEDLELTNKLKDVLKGAVQISRSDDKALVEAMQKSGIAFPVSEKGVDFDIYVEFKNHSKPMGSGFLAMASGGNSNIDSMKLSVKCKREGLSNTRKLLAEGEYLSEELDEIKVKYQGYDVVSVRNYDQLKEMASIINAKHKEIIQKEEDDNLNSFMAISTDTVEDEEPVGEIPYWLEEADLNEV